MPGFATDNLVALFNTLGVNIDAKPLTESRSLIATLLVDFGAARFSRGEGRSRVDSRLTMRTAGIACGRVPPLKVRGVLCGCAPHRSTVAHRIC